MSGFLQDLRYALRQLRKNPGFTAVALITLALGIGANTAVFSVIYAVVLRPLPFHDPARIVAVKTTEPNRRDDIGVSYPAFLDWRSRNHVFEGLSAFRTDDFTLTGRGAPSHVTGAVLSANTFSLLGVAPVIGRDFTPSEDAPSNTGSPVILSHNLWRERFLSDPNISGQSITLSGQVFTVIGVMPTGFQFPVQTAGVDFWTTIALDVQSSNGNPPMAAQRGVSYLDVIGRLKDRVKLAQAQTDMAAIQGSLNREYPENRPKGIAIVPELDDVVGQTRFGLYVLLGAVGLILLIACANLSNLLLAKATARRKEFTVRAALGATRRLILRQLLTEGLLLAAGGAAAGLLLAIGALHLLTEVAPIRLPRLSESGLSVQVLTFTAVIAVLTSILFGLVPALHASTRELATSLNEEGRGGTEARGRRRLQDTFVVIETALAVVLLAGAGLLLRSLLGLGKVDPGFAKDHVITFGLDLPSRYGHFERVQFYQQLLSQIRSLPGVHSASAVFPLPLSADEVKTSYDVEGRPVRTAQRDVTTLHLVDNDYFHTLGIPLLSGREFDSRDSSPVAVPVVVISQALAKQAFPGENPIGMQIKPDISSGKNPAVMRLIVGVVGDVTAEGLAAPPVPESYVPYGQLPFAPMSVVVRTAVDPESIVGTLTKAVQSLDKDLPLLHVKTLDEYLADSVADTRFETFLLSIFGALAFVLTCVGLYGVISYTVVQQTREMGIRLALGAGREMILRMVIGRGLVLAGVGISVGLAMALILTRFIATLLYGVRPWDPLTFLAVPVALIVMALIASFVPARRAANVDPMGALRYE
ncbi:MAG TPA: ABC transporter permease [Candidatus Sulfotelmatobacter sp.]|nr:ABC transporter permease [Candidatus Sulfotelmatobacter sp.]